MAHRTFIEKIEIKNYRLCKNTIFSPNDNLSALIGPNGSGKTTILKGLLLLKAIIEEDPYRRRRSVDPIEKVDPTEIRVHLNIDGKKIIHKSLLQIDNDNANDDNIIESKQTWIFSEGFFRAKKQFTLPAWFVGRLVKDKNYKRYHLFSKQAAVPEVFKNKNSREALSSIITFYKGITYYSASKFTNPSLCPVSFEIEEDIYRTSKEYSGHTKWLTDIYKCYKDSNEEFQSFIEIVGKNGLQLIDNFNFQEITASKVDLSVKVGGKVKQKNRENKIIVPQIEIGKSILSPSQLSEGTFKTLGLIFYLLTGKNSLILLEEPEVCIHHGLLSSVVELIKKCSRDKQVFVSTHSDFILDSLEDTSVHIIRKDATNGITAKRLDQHLSRSDKNALKNFLSAEGSLGEYWKIGGFDE